VSTPTGPTVLRPSSGSACTALSPAEPVTQRGARSCRVEVRLAVDCAVSAAAGTPEVGLGDRGRGRLVPDHHRCVDNEAELCRQEFLDSLVDARGCWSVKKFPAPRSVPGCDPGPQWSGIRFTCSWVMPGRPSGTLIGGSRRSVSGRRRSRGCISAVGRPLCQVYALTGAS
jgi:hypothetical protein